MARDLGGRFITLLGGPADDWERLVAAWGERFEERMTLIASQRLALRLRMLGGSQVEYARLKVKLDPTTSPKLFDITVGDGIQKGAVMEGIYELKGDEFKVCAKVLGNERPTEFASPEGASVVLVIFKREKP